MNIKKEQFVRYIDHSLLKPHLTIGQVKKGCEFALEANCASVCVNTISIPLAKEILNGSNTKVGTVIGFPSGAHTTYTKVKETEEAYKLGAMEVDMVINIGALKSKQYDVVLNDIKEIVKASPAIVKVILEMYYLDEEEKIIGCKIAEDAGAQYVKTSTGFAQGGATVHDIRLMKKAVSECIKVKAAGGIKDLSFAIQLLEAGCDRLGISSTQEMMRAFNN